MDLPETYRSAAGLTVAGAGPDLLRQLLEVYERELALQDPAYVAAMLPGLPREVVEAELRRVGVPASEELVVWWGWHNGVDSSFYGGPSQRQASLEETIASFENGLTPHSGLPGDGWLPLSGHNNSGFAARYDGELGATVVRHFEPGLEFVLPEPPLDQVISLCTPVSWWTRALHEGWHTLAPGSPNQIADVTRYPMDWRFSALI